MKKLIFLLIATIVFANVTIKVNKTKISPGDEVIFTISAEGKNVKLPNVEKIGHYRVEGSANSENITIINEEMHSTVSRSYMFYPLKDVVIPSFKVIVDGKTYYTKPIKIKVEKLKKTKDKDYDLSIGIDKNETYLGEGRVLTIKFSQRIDANAQSIQIQRPNLDNFLVNQILTKTYEQNNKKVTVYKFLIIPQKSGKLTIGPIIANIGILQRENPFHDPFFSAAFINYKRIVSNEVVLNVKPIPKNSIWGNFSLNLQANKNEVLSNTTVKIILTVKGCGDFYDMKDFKLNIPNATIYEKKPILKTVIKNNKLCGIYKKEFDVIASSDFNITNIGLLEFNGSLHYIKANPIFVKVKNSSYSVTKVENYTSNSKNKTLIIYKTNYWLVFVSFIVGVFIGYILNFFFHKKTKKEKNLIEKIKKADEKELFKLLLPYSENKEIDEILKQLEENIYKGAKHKIDKKKIIKILEFN
jgi:hypothetical protein